MAKMIKEISVFFPAYKEEANIKKVVSKATSILDRIAERYEIIVVEDGILDKTSNIVKEMMRKNKNIKLVQHKNNKGYGAALISGVYNSRYEWIAFTDSDGQFDFSEITNFIKTQEETNADLVIGYYKKRKVPFYRIINSKIWEFIIRIMFGLKVKDIDCGFKLIRKKVVDSIPRLESQRGAFISTEFLVKAKMKGFKIVEIPVTHYERKAGTPTGANLKVIINSFKDLFALRKKLKDLS